MLLFYVFGGPKIHQIVKPWRSVHAIMMEDRGWMLLNQDDRAAKSRHKLIWSYQQGVHVSDLYIYLKAFPFSSSLLLAGISCRQEFDGSVGPLLTINSA